MPKPVTLMVSCDVFITNEDNQVLLIKRTGSGVWATPGGFHDLGETPEQCAVREAKEETGYDVGVTRLLGVFSSNMYEYHYHKYPDEEIAQILFAAKIVGGSPRKSKESTDMQWFSQDTLPALFDGHEKRIKFGFKWLHGEVNEAFFE